MKALFFAISISVVLFSCNQNNNSPAPSSSNNTPTNTNPTGFNGFFPLERYVEWYNGSIAGNAIYNCKMQLYTNPVIDYTTWQAANLGTVTVNGVGLKYNSIVHIYMDSTGSSNYSSMRLINLNSSSLPSFTISVTDTFPSYTSANAVQINDTLFLNSTFTVPLNGVTGYDAVSAQITHVPNGTVGPIVTKNYSSMVNQIQFTSSDFSVFSPGQQLYLRLVLKKYSTQTVSSSNYRFECLSYNDFYFVAQ